VFAQFSGGGTGSEQDPYRIVTAADLRTVRSFVGKSHANKYFRMMNDIDLTAFLANNPEGWFPIGDNENKSFEYKSFAGHFNGGGHKVKGLRINRTVDEHSVFMGLFGYNTGTIDSLGVSGAIILKISGYSYSGGLVGYNTGSITNCYATVEVSSSYSSSHSGGLIGYNTGVITNCYAAGNVSSSTPFASYSGGLIGQNTGIITNCSATGKSSASAYSYSYSGGLIGHNSGTITNCSATGATTSSSSASNYIPSSSSGGLIGQNTGDITNCYATGKSSSSAGTYSSDFSGRNHYSGGLIGHNSGTITDSYATGSSSSPVASGGLTGYNSGDIKRCYATGESSSGYSGGLTGYNENGSITDSYATGNVKPVIVFSSGYGGGLIGYLNSGKVITCYSAGIITGKDSDKIYKGALIGYNNYDADDVDNIISRCYYNVDVAGILISVGSGAGIENVQGLSTTEMKMKKSFMYWDFNTVWNIDEENSYPYLRLQRSEKNPSDNF
jgi:hypothetical protein